MNKYHFLPAAILATLVLGFNISLAYAEPNATINIRDLDLRKSQDVAQLYTRIERNAAEVCSRAASPWDAGRVAYVKRCTGAAINDAVERANVKALTVLHESKTQPASKVAQNRDK